MSQQNTKFDTRIKVSDCFAGAGGMSLGFHMAGFETVHPIEWMPYAMETYNNNIAKHYGKKYETMDITKQETKDAVIQTMIKDKVDVITGGFPCQGFSFAGNKAEQYIQIGNAVPPLMAKAIANSVKNMISLYRENERGV